MSGHVDTLVIGAGPAGLTTAYTLAKSGFDETSLLAAVHRLLGARV